MKKKITIYCFAIAVIFQMIFLPVKIYALNYTISFTGTGASTLVESVLVQNLTKGTEVTVPTGNVLNLTDITTSVDNLCSNVDGIAVYPNPMQGKSTVSFFAKNDGNTQINVFGVDGRNLTYINSNLQEGYNQFQLSLAQGAYILKVNGNGYTYASKVISESNSTNKPTISFIGDQKPTNSEPQKAKSGGSVTSMLYSIGDQLIYKGISGNYATIVADKPTESNTVDFYFVDCKDADDNYYPVVIIGSQIWMAENLKTTSYRTGESVSNVTVASSWATATFGAWCDYSNLIANGTKYGHLYNWYAVADTRKITPVGWHVPTDAEYTTLSTYLGGISVAGGKLKEIGSTNWTSPNTAATNETGFSALPCGLRTNGGTFNDLGGYSYWWTATESSAPSAASNWGVDYFYCYFNKLNYDKLNGLSVRCLSDIVVIIPPTLEATTTASAITGTTAKSGGNVTLQGGAAVTAKGVCWSTTNNPTKSLSTKTSNGTGTGVFTSSITGLTPNTTYFVRSYATNSGGTAYGSEVSFQTATTPTLTTTSASDVASTTATCGGNITSDGRATVTSRGVCWSTSPSPTINDNKTSDGTGTGVFTSSITILFFSTTYYVRAYATNSVGTAYGDEQTLTTTMTTDIDGNFYSAIKIGTQTWMGENLKTTKYRTGESISKPTTTTNWSNATFGAWCDYNSDTANGLKYGHLYNWYAVADTRNIAPEGWHVPTDAEWTTLTTYLGGEALAGGKLKEAGTANWGSPNTDATNESGFTALPGGFRSSSTGAYGSQGLSGLWWSSSESGTGGARNRDMGYNYGNVNRGDGSKSDGISIRCILNVVPTISTTAISNIAGNSATSGGNITLDGGGTITARGVCWSTSPSPTIANGKTSDGTGTGIFTSSLTGLIGNTTYYVRAYATNAVGTAYGNDVIFTTNFYGVGTPYLGGKIAYVDASGIHGFVCTLTDQSTGMQWYNGSNITIGATNKFIETTGVYGITKSGGRKNTDAIIARQGAGTYAASICAALTIGSATAGDWYLPSTGELDQMCANKIILGISNANFWSSTEYNDSNAWYHYTNGENVTYLKSFGFYVRAVRAF